MTTLSILVPTVAHRMGLLSRLLWGITEQAAGHAGDVEVLVAVGERAGMGTKLDEMFRQARGEWVVCVDDDDQLSGAYMDEVLPALREGAPDFLGYRILVTEGGRYWFEATHRGDVKGWDGAVRGATPKCPVRTAIARQVPFPNEYTGDRAWSSRVGELVKTHAYIDRALYHYDHWNQEMLGTEPGQRPEAWVSTDRVGSWMLPRLLLSRLVRTIQVEPDEESDERDGDQPEEEVGEEGKTG